MTGSEGGPLGGGKRAHRHQNCEEKKIFSLQLTVHGHPESKFCF